MRKPHKGCKERDAYFHWNDHSDDQDKHFFKVLIGDFRNRLTIPDKFVQHFRGKIARSINLESRRGFTFDVQVAMNLGRLVLQSGWKSFVSAHNLKMLDFLIFKYDGISHLKVLIFDPSGCEKVPPCFVTKNAICDGQKREEPIEVSSNCANLSMKASETKKKEWKQRDRSKIVSITSSSILSESSGDVTSSEDNEAHSVPSYIIGQRTCLITSVQKKKLKEKVRAIHSKIPIYVCIMKKSNASRRSLTMDFSGEYADLYLPFKEQTMMLHRHGKSWEVRCSLRIPKGRRTYKRLLKGWAWFARDNNLQLGDLCLFELLKSKKYMMNVHIIRAK